MPSGLKSIAIFAQSAVKRAKYDGLMRNIRANEDFYKH